MSKRLEKLTYALKQKLSKKGKNPDDFRIKEKRGEKITVVNIKTGEELVFE